MAYAQSNLFKIGGANPGVWMYKSTDAIATVAASGYLSDSTNALKNGDVVIVVDTNTPTVDVCVVSSATGATPVTLVNGT
jgi:hypothetical protein